LIHLFVWKIETGGGGKEENDGEKRNKLPFYLCGRPTKMETTLCGLAGARKSATRAR
jgi:hypothetical protein